MPRKARIDAPGALHHIIVRGIERRKIFRDDADRYDFITRLGRILEQTGTKCFAWALIPNHFHLLLRTGNYPLAHVMRRLLTGHAIYFNRRHRRSGHLFQNRYKSILCQEDAYLLELVRYIHLNPLRARLVKDMNQLGTYPFSGHGVVMGKHSRPWQDAAYVLAFFGKRAGPARRNYRTFITKGISQGRRSDLIGGGLVRSSGGWAAVIALRASKAHMKSDERILGDGEFVTAMLRENDESFDQKYELQTRGIDLDYIAQRVTELLDMAPGDIWQQGRYRQLVTARSLLCYWAVRKLNISMASLSRRLKISTVAVSKSVQRGADIAKQNDYHLI
jgi:REP element-mobilizing transposase RayT